MDPSSLIFVVIVAIWAAYLLGHWVRRRDHLATVRSVDRFSAAMRVLERRPAVRAVPLSRPNPRSYVVAPASRPASDVTVKRAPAVSRPLEPQPQPQPQPQPAARKRPTPVRGLLLLGLLVATPVVWVLVPLTAMSWVAGLAVTAALIANLAYLRHTVRRRREQQRRLSRQELRSASQARRQSRRDVVGQVVAANRTRAHVPVVAEIPDHAPDESVVDDGSWQPVPVPPPTYTLKPKAPAPAPRRPVLAEPAAVVEEPVAPAAPAAAVAAPAASGGFDLDEILERRIAANG
ncbi:hypothetical protein ACPPVT_04235 [Angustibacter sp. McL0619]|uniref:hypothetical protein n=1 Tax=Angustibacter sp. McL0619 TaxID=3415676 RepID=UPI003CEAB229